jgi:RND family efflux transporter MFP subunit
VAGYLKSWKVDIGSEVKAGQLLAEIETPELDQQLLQARADLASAQANATMAEKSARRWQAMVGSDAVSQQEADEKSNDLMVKQSVVKALQANVERMEVLKGFARIQAPFAGTVTARSTDVGALINPGSSGGAELFVIADTRRLRLYVSVPQNQTAKIGPGTEAQVTVPERPGKRYPAKVEASAQAVQAASGTVLMQLSVDNSAGELLPGSYARVSLALPQAAEGLNIPVSALLFDKSGLRVATVDAENRVRLKTVTLLRDLGKSIDIGTGLTASDRVIESPPDGINDGDPVQIAAPESKSPAEGKPATDGKRDAGKG